MPFKAILFDLDGTLLNTLADLADAMNAVLRHHNFSEHDITAYPYFIGNGLTALVKRALPADSRDDATVSICLESLDKEYANRLTAKTRPYGGIPELLDKCAASGLKMVILSNKPEPATQKIVAALLSSWHFEIVRGSRSDIPKKPDPTAALLISRSLGMAPEDFIYLGDSDVDMQTAASAGMFAAGALWGFRDAPELIKGGARMIIKTPLDLVPWV
jgi:phosphoglycolate phosphatase